MVPLFMATYDSSGGKILTKGKKYPVYKIDFKSDSIDHYFLIVNDVGDFQTIAAYYFKLETKLDEVLK